MKKIFLFLVSLLFINVSFAQPQRNFPNPADMHEKKWQAITEQVSLTPAETATVKPLFLEYEQNLWKLHLDGRKYFTMQQKKDLTTQNYSEINDNYINAELKKAMLLRDYHLQLKKALKPETLYQYYKAERMFKRKLLKNLPPHPEKSE